MRAVARGPARPQTWVQHAIPPHHRPVRRAHTSRQIGHSSDIDPLFHIARAEDWDAAAAGGAYRLSTLGRSLDEVGFVHLSFAHQVKGVADRFYRGIEGLLLLRLDPVRLDAPVRVEAVPGSDERFPHLYGPIPVDAVIAVLPYPPRPDGTFDPLSP